jgi:HEAT repeat protein
MKIPKPNKISALLLGLLVLTVSVVLTAGPAAWAYTDTSDSDQESPEYQKARELYKKAQQALNREQYREAAGYFEDVYDRYDDSPYAADALYWRAFALYRLGGKNQLQDARKALEIQRDLYRKASIQEDAEELYSRILGKLAAQGDPEAAHKVQERANTALSVDSDVDVDVDMDEKIAALHALINMQSERAIPLLESILKDRDPEKSKLREQALFLLCQHNAVEAVALLIDIAKNDPDPEMRKNALFWLSQNSSPESFVFLEDLIADTTDPEIMEQALFAISQQGGEKSSSILKKVIQNEAMSPDTRAQAIFWLGQNGDDNDIEFLKSIYNQLDDEKIKERILFAVSQNSIEQNSQWLMDIAFNENEPIEMRKMALFWTSQQSRIDLDRLVKMYHTIGDREMREQVIFAMSQRNEKTVVEAMIKLARQEKDPELREQLVFWIGQSGHPSAEDFLLEIINN